MAINPLGATPPIATDSKPAGSSKLALKTEDFIKMMITQLQHQDPMEPAKNEQLLAQMSQIGQLQSSTQLQDSLKGMMLQNQIGSSAQLIGKTVTGLDAADDPVEGMVNSVRVVEGNVTLELDNGKTLSMSKVTSISPGPTAAGDAPAVAPKVA